MFQKIHILLAIITFYTNICLAEIITTNNFKVIEDHVKSADLNTLIIFDIDHVLLQPKDCSLRPYYDDKEHEKAKNFFNKVSNKLTVEEQSEAILQMQVELVDTNLIKLVNSLQNRAVKVLALTARDTGKFGKIASLENFTIKELQHFGYHFEKSWPKLNDQIFEQIPPKTPKHFPIFKQGILFTNGTHKGPVLEFFLNYTQMLPHKIIFIDDQKKNLQSVASFTKKNNLKFLGIEYTIVKDQNQRPFNEERANLQFDIFRKNHKWLSDQEADRILYQKKIEFIKNLTKEIYLEQKNFPQGDYKDLHFVKKIINLMYLLDQKVRSALINDFTNNTKLVSSMDKFHTDKIKEILKEHGWINISKFGKEADQQAWTLVQHADHDPFFQAGCAFVLEKLVKSGETNQQNYAYLYDRAILQFQNLGLKQKYGTQAINNNGHITLLPYDGNINEVNKRRKSINLDSVDQYLKQLKNIYIVE